MKLEDNIRKVVPYVPGEQPNRPNMIKLNTNECPYPPSQKVLDALNNIDIDHMRLYPDPDATILIEAIAHTYGVQQDQVFVGVGSDDVLAMAFLTFFNSESPILFPDITYSFYDVWANLFKIPFKTCPLDDNFMLNTADYMGENGGIIFPNPNAPTGVLESLENVEEVIKANPDVVMIVDEAYIDFGGVSALPLIEKYDNLLVVQTFSKSRAMAGARIGYAFGNPKLIGYLKDAKFSFNSYTMNRPSLVMGVASLEDSTYFEEMTTKIIETREWTKIELTRLGFTFPDSYANFIFATHETVPAEQIYKTLRESDIFVRYFNKPRIDQYLRITIGTRAEMEALISKLQQIL
ncbi:MAG: histidinol-phosphate transaminase [Lachnospiraceae bacterium]